MAGDVMKEPDVVGAAEKNGWTGAGLGAEVRSVGIDLMRGRLLD